MLSRSICVAMCMRCKMSPCHVATSPGNWRIADNNEAFNGLRLHQHCNKFKANYKCCETETDRLI